jgi:hypothetical protein
VGLPGGGFAMLWRGSPVGATLIGSRAVLNSIKFMVSGHQCLMPAPRGNILDINGPAPGQGKIGAPDWPCCAGGQ